MKTGADPEQYQDDEATSHGRQLTGVLVCWEIVDIQQVPGSSEAGDGDGHLEQEVERVQGQEEEILRGGGYVVVEIQQDPLPQENETATSPANLQGKPARL